MWSDTAVDGDHAVSAAASRRAHDAVCGSCHAPADVCGAAVVPVGRCLPRCARASCCSCRYATGLWSDAAVDGDHAALSLRCGVTPLLTVTTQCLRPRAVVHTTPCVVAAMHPPTSVGQQWCQSAAACLAVHAPRVVPAATRRDCGATPLFAGVDMVSDVASRRAQVKVTGGRASAAAGGVTATP